MFYLASALAIWIFSILLMFIVGVTFSDTMSWALILGIGFGTAGLFVAWPSILEFCVQAKEGKK
jgi:preprotein translocase subunit SecF